MITAKWKEGVNFYNDADANKVAQEILSIGDSATAEQIVDVARNEASELHKCFEWDDSVAAEKYRCTQARQLVCNLVIKEVEIPEDRPEVRYFFMPKKNAGYKPTQVIVRKEDEYQQLLAQAWSELQAFKRKYSCLTELQEIFDLIQ